MNKHYLPAILILIALIPLSSAQEDFLNTRKADLDINISSSITLAPSSSDYSVDYILADLSFFPREDDRQKITELITSPEAQTIGNSLRYRWENDFSSLGFSASSELETKNIFNKITRKIEFPIESLPEEIIPYTLPSDNIDSNETDIITLSSFLAEGEDDLYIVVNKLANWVEDNVEYSLDTLTAEVSQKASWVLNKREGVCDELTSLFIAMARSLGIPGKYISGMAYTNWKGLNDFGPHAWAEIYFPGYGWVPFDITYNQLGFIDLSHIKLKESIDSDEPSIEYEWKGTDIDIETQNLDIKTKILNKEGKIEPQVSIKAKAIKSSIGFGSYNLIEAEITNLKNFYFTTGLSISKTKELEVAGKREKNVALKPNEKKKVYWIIELKPGLDSKYTYTFPIQIYSIRNTTSETSFTSSVDEPIFTYKEINSLKEDMEEEAVKKYSKEVDLNCTTEKAEYYAYENPEYYAYENPEIDCRIRNLGNVFLKDLKLCLEKDCHTINLGISQIRIISFDTNFSSPGKKELKVIAKNDQISKAAYLKFTALDKPNIIINDIEFPTNVLFNQGFSINFKLEKHSLSNPEDIEVRLNQGGLIKSWNIDELHNDQKFIIDLEGKILNEGENSFEILVEYKDKNNLNYNTTEEFSITLEDVTLIQKLQIMLNRLAQRIEGWLG
ncbi:hypothetical protein CMO89_03320 [Candidatus Woesearchaeota archaeon]|nr:hypothetical protein [Candidatus Woesearchaeota archaeon]|tara:strand:+ start:1076 stop:3091 length:2016 start_codon:yes stop_codon:yes gene_type:complete